MVVTLQAHAKTAAQLLGVEDSRALRTLSPDIVWNLRTFGGINNRLGRLAT